MESLAELRTLIAGHAGEGVTRTALDGVSLMASDVTTEPIGSVAQPALAIVAAGAKRTVLNESVFEYGAGEYLIVSVDLPLTAHISRASREQPFLAFGLVLKPAATAELLLASAPVVDGRRRAAGSP